MASTELFGVITVVFEFIRYTEQRLKLFSSFHRKTKPLYCLFY